MRSVETGRNDVIAWERSAGDRRLTVVANLSDDEIRDYRLPQASARFGRDLLQGKDVDPNAA